MNTKDKGSLAVAQCIAKLCLLGYEVLLPLGDRKCYDLVFDDGKRLNRVQVKYAGKGSRGKYLAYLRITGGNQSFNYAKKYKDDDFDYLYIFTAFQLLGKDWRKKSTSICLFHVSSCIYISNCIFENDWCG